MHWRMDLGALLPFDFPLWLDRGRKVPNLPHQHSRDGAVATSRVRTLMSLYMALQNCNSCALHLPHLPSYGTNFSLSLHHVVSASRAQTHLLGLDHLELSDDKDGLLSVDSHTHRRDKRTFAWLNDLKSSDPSQTSHRHVGKTRITGGKQVRP